MNEAIFIFISGMLGVFAGMGLLYLAIRITTVAEQWFAARKPEKSGE